MKKLKVKGKLPKPRNPLVQVVMKMKSSKHEKTKKAIRRENKVAFLKSIYCWTSFCVLPSDGKRFSFHGIANCLVQQ